MKFFTPPCDAAKGHAIMRNMKVAIISETARAYGREFLNGVAHFAQEQRDWYLRLFSPDDIRGRRPFAAFDGIIARVIDASSLRKIKACGLPVIDVFSHNPQQYGFIGVGPDDQAIADRAAAFFLGRGFRSFAYCGYRGTGFSDARLVAFRANLAKTGHSVLEYPEYEPMTDAFIFNETPDRTPHPSALRDWVRSLPVATAVFCANDMRAYQVIKIASELGIRIPQELSVLGTDNDNFICLFSTTPISSIDPDAHGVGYAAARLMQAAVKDPPSRKKRPLFRVHPGALHERASTEFRPISPEWLSEALVFIDQNIHHPLSASDVVARCQRSPNTVAKAFLKNFGLTPGRYITKLKMEEARRLINLHTHSCKEIAALLGFASPQYFCCAYRTYFGHSPFSS